MNAPRPKSLEIRKLAHTKPNFPPPFSTSTEASNISLLYNRLWSALQLNTNENNEKKVNAETAKANKPQIR